MSSPTPPTSNNKPGKDLPNELRMVIAFVLMGLILVGSQWLYRKMGWVPTPKPAQTAMNSAVPAKDTGKETAPAAPTATPAAAASTQEPAEATAIAAVAESEWTLDTNLYRIVFSNRGASVKSWTLKKFKGDDGKPLEIVNTRGAEKAGYPFTYDFRGQQPSTNLNNALWVAHPGGGGLSIEYRFSDGRTTATKTFAFQSDAYLVQFSDEVKLGAAGIPHLIQWRGGFGDMAVYNAADHQQGIRYDTEKKKLIEQAAKAAKDGPARSDGSFSFAGIQDQYFAAAFLPPQSEPVQTTLFDDIVASPADNAEKPYPGVAVGGSARNQMALYLGPKAVSTLGKINPRLEDLIDWGWFGIIARPLFLILQWMTNLYVHNYGWSIILLTVAINIALLPLRIANLKSMKKMQALQPEMAKINEKYKGIGMSDPKAALKQQETMDLYKKHGVNPMGGCIPMLIQLPFLYAFYKVLAVTIEMRGANWLWIGDLSQPEHFAIRFLPIIMVVSSFLMQKMTPMAGGDPSQQKVMQFMPLMWGFFFWSASSGLVLYWLTSNLVQITQQWFFNKTASPVTVIASPKKVTSSSSKDIRKRT
jgi:YidC/Oxa1 family membrane protein insertase